MSDTFVNWTSRVAIAARIAEYRRPDDREEQAIPDDYHAPFIKAEAQTKAAKWFWQAYVI